MVPKWVWILRELMGGVERGISPPCQGEKNAIYIYSLPTTAQIGEERGISGKDVADYKGRNSI